jgi:hypothetical protein
MKQNASGNANASAKPIGNTRRIITLEIPKLQKSK